MKITKEMLKEWSACASGYQWFLKAFPQGGDVHAVGSALRADKRCDDSAWLANNVFDHLIKDSAGMSEYVKTDVQTVIAEVADITVAVDDAESSNEETAQIGSSGDYAKIGSSGDYAKIDATGKNTVIACAGSVSKFRASEGGCIAAPWNDGPELALLSATSARTSRRTRGIRLVERASS